MTQATAAILCASDWILCSFREIAASNAASPFTVGESDNYKGAMVRLGANLKFGP